MRNNNLANVLIVLLFLTMGCAPAGSKFPPNKPFTPIVDSKYIDLSPFSGFPCAAPCWNNLFVDQSAKEDVLSTLHSVDVIEQSSIRETLGGYWDPSYAMGNSVIATTIFADCKEPKDKACYQFDIVNNVLKRVIVFPNYTVTLKNAVDYFGEPSCLLTHAWGPECVGCGIELSWASRQLSVSVLDQRCANGAKLCDSIRHGGKIPGDYVIESIVYYSQAWNNNEIQECLPWTGFEDRVP